jgi:hypothetical protein
MTSQQMQTKMGKEHVIKEVIDKCRFIFSHGLNGSQEVEVGNPWMEWIRVSDDCVLMSSSLFREDQHDEKKDTEREMKQILDRLLCIIPSLVSLANNGFESGALLFSEQESSSTTSLSVSRPRKAQKTEQPVLAKRARGAVQVLAYATLLGNSTYVVTLVRHYHILVPLFDALEHWAFIGDRSRKDNHSMLCLVLEALERVFDVYLDGDQFSEHGCRNIDYFEVVTDLLSYSRYDDDDEDDEWKVIACLEDLQENSKSEEVEDRAFKILEKILEVEGVEDESWASELDIERLEIVPFDECVKTPLKSSVENAIAPNMVCSP